MRPRYGQALLAEMPSTILRTAMLYKTDCEWCLQGIEHVMLYALLAAFMLIMMLAVRC